MRLKDTLKQLRVDANYTQSELAFKMGVKQYNISDYEVGRIEPSIEILLRYADVFHVSLDYILGRSRTKNAFSSKEEDPYLKAIEREMQNLSDKDKQKVVESLIYLIRTYLQ